MCPNHKFSVFPLFRLCSGGRLAYWCGRSSHWVALRTLASLLRSSSSCWRKDTAWTNPPTAHMNCKQELPFFKCPLFSTVSNVCLHYISQRVFLMLVLGYFMSSTSNTSIHLWALSPCSHRGKLLSSKLSSFFVSQRVFRVSFWDKQ